MASASVLYLTYRFPRKERICSFLTISTIRRVHLSKFYHVA